MLLKVQSLFCYRRSLLQVAYLMLKLSLREVFEFQFMQTDPNWSNFFYNTETKKVSYMSVNFCNEF